MIDVINIDTSRSSYCQVSPSMDVGKLRTSHRESTIGLL